MKSFEENCKELFMLSEVLHKQNFRACFFEHFTTRVAKISESITSDINVSILQSLQLKLLEPLMLHLRTTDKSDHKCLLLNCLIKVLKLTAVDNVNIFFHLYALIFFQIYNSEKLAYYVSEELKLAVLECGSFLIENSSHKTLNEVYKEESGAKFSMGISTSVDIAKEDKSIKLRIAALDFLLVATQYHKHSNYNKGIYKKVGDLFMLYLPGTIGPLQNIILRDETQHHLITVKALTCWGHILCLVMSDTTNSNLSDIDILKNWIEMSQNRTEEMIDITKVLREKKRTKKWLEAAAITLKPLILKISEVRKHSNAKCRLELTKVMVKLLENCMINLKVSLTPIIEVLASSEEDEDEEVCTVSKEAIARFENECEKKNKRIFATVIEENLYFLINRLPGIVHGGNENIILPSLKSFLGYIKILGRMNRFQSLMSLSSTLKKLIVVIQLSLEMETYPEISNKELSVWDKDISSKIWSKPWKRFRHFCDDFIRIQLENICQALGEFGEVEILIDYLIDIYQKEYRLRKELLLIINEVILGAKNIESNVVNQILDLYLDPENLYLTLEVDDVECPNLKEAHSNILKVALIMEGIGKLATRCGQNFQNYLLKSLYYVIEGMGSSYSIIRQSATKSAIEISKACGVNGDISSLIRANVDYLTFNLTTKLKRNEPGVFDVVTVLMKNSPFETMPNLEEIINNVLYSSSKNFDSLHTISYLRLFQTFVICVNEWLATSKEKQKSEITLEDEEDKHLNDFIKFVKNVEKKSEEISEEEEPTEMEDELKEEDFQNEPEKPKPPRHIIMIVSIANHCLHYLPSKERDKRILVLEILNDSVLILADWEDELLPLVHKIWSPLVTRYDQNSDPLIINKSFSLLCTLSRTSRQFIRSRTLKEVLPVLRNFLIKAAPQSRLKDSASGYYFTQNFKLQKILLENLGRLALDLELFERQTDLIAECALPYLSSSQPKELQEKCRILFKDLTTHDPYLVWWKLHVLVNKPEFSKNVQIILNYTNK